MFETKGFKFFFRLARPLCEKYFLTKGSGLRVRKIFVCWLSSFNRGQDYRRNNPLLLKWSACHPKLDVIGHLVKIFDQKQKQKLSDRATLLVSLFHDWIYNFRRKDLSRTICIIIYGRYCNLSTYLDTYLHLKTFKYLYEIS